MSLSLSSAKNSAEEADLFFELGFDSEFDTDLGKAPEEDAADDDEEDAGGGTGGPLFLASKKQNSFDEDALEEFYTLVTHVPVAPGAYKGLETQVAEDE